MPDTDLVPAGARKPYRSNLAQGLLESGLLTGEQLEAALAKQMKTGERLEAVVVALGLATERDIARVLAKQLNVPFVELNTTCLDPDLARVIPGFVAEKHQLVVVGRDSGTVTVAMADPIDIVAIDDLRLLTGCTIQVVVAAPADVRQALARVYSADYHLQMLMRQIETECSFTGGRDGSGGGEPLQLPETDVNEAPTNRLVNLMFQRALVGEASEIHVEPFGDQLRIRLRRDGLLFTDMNPPAVARQAIVNRIKVLAALPPGESRSPRVTRFRLTMADREVDVRISSLPTASGEKFCLRLLDTSAVQREPRALGFDEAGLVRFERALAAGAGIIVLAGPHDSGKTTSMYAALALLNRSADRQIVSIENPVERQIAGVAQLGCRPEDGYGWADALRAAMGQSPDVIMVAELADAETAALAARAAAEGRLVLTSLPALDAAGVIDRLLELGLARPRIASMVTLIQTQRLVRTLCRSCRKEWKADLDIVERLGLDVKTLRRIDLPHQDHRSPTLYRCEGCPDCRGAGHRGRTGVLECLAMSRKVQQVLRRGRSVAELIRAAQAEGMLSMREAMLRKALTGETSAGEALRILRT